jgi:hypothetical protein
MEIDQLSGMRQKIGFMFKNHFLSVYSTN